MATGNLFLGTARKKLGDVVLYRANGKQRSRIRVTPKNPRSAKQAIQRMVLATAAKMASAYEPIVNHSFEGITEGAKSVQEFRRLAMKALRGAAAVYINDPSADRYRKAGFALKGAPIVGALEGLQLSRGSLSMNSATLLSDNVLTIALTDALSSANITTQEGYEAELAKLGIEPGDQLTFITQLVNLDEAVASADYGDGNTYENFAQQVRFCRVVFKPQLPDSFSGTLLSGTAINPALIQESYGTLPAFSGTTGTGGAHLLSCSFADILPQDYDVQTAGVIRSKFVEGYKYSTCFMLADYSLLDVNDADSVYPSYMDGVASISVGETLYLKHAVAAPFVTGE